MVQKSTHLGTKLHSTTRNGAEKYLSLHKPTFLEQLCAGLWRLLHNLHYCVQLCAEKASQLHKTMPVLKFRCRKALFPAPNRTTPQEMVQKSTHLGTKLHSATRNGAEKHPFWHQTLPEATSGAEKHSFRHRTALRHKKWCRKAPIWAPNSARSNFRCRKTLFPAPNCTTPEEMLQKKGQKRKCTKKAAIKPLLSVAPTGLEPVFKV